MKPSLILVDMDGVLADFVGHFFQYTNLPLPNPWPKGEFNLAKLLGIPGNEVWRLVEGKVDFWRTMPKTPEFGELMDIVDSSGVSWMVATAPSHDPVSALGKVLWLQDVFGRHFNNYLLCPYKHLLAAPGLVLIDDKDKNLEGFSRGGIAIPVPRPWNKWEGHPLEHVRAFFK